MDRYVIRMPAAAMVLAAAMTGSALLAAPVKKTAKRTPKPAGSAVLKAPKHPSLVKGPTAVKTTRGVEKLAPELQALYRQFSAPRTVDALDRFSADELRSRFGITGAGGNPPVQVAISMDAGASHEPLADVGVTVHFRMGNTLYAAIPVLRLEQATRQNGVSFIVPIGAGNLPPVPRDDRPARIGLTLPSRNEKLATDFDRQGMTGKGVIVAVLDTGIDWKHQDFIREDGTSRILALYDMFDTAWDDSGGKVGTKPPYTYSDTKKSIGTVYTNEQINAALKGMGTVNSKDTNGHGTACAGIAAGNGRATANGVPAGTYVGVAPQADLLVVKVELPKGGISSLYPHAARWAFAQAKALGRPCVINGSFGGHFSAHDGSEEEEALLDQMVGPGKPGAAICLSAGNEGRYSFHSGGIFGPRREGQQDVESRPAELFVSSPTTLTVYFDHADEWGFVVTGLDTFFIDEKGGPLHAFFFKQDDKITGKLMAKAKEPADFTKYFNESFKVQNPLPSNPKVDRIELRLPPGKYLVRGFGVSEKVTSGRFDCYLPMLSTASFGRGGDKRFMVGTPGNAANVITVGSYNFRSAWTNMDGKVTNYNLPIGDLSDYSSPGYRRDGMVKPDITAPAQYAISSLAADSEMGKGADGKPDTARISRDGFHLAWNGTSAASPFVAGVVALMLEKNPGLDSAQIKEALVKTRIKDDQTGSVPNPSWGHGKIDPAAALRAAPAK